MVVQGRAQGEGSVLATTAVEHTRKRRCLSHDGGGNTTQMQCLSHEGSGETKAKAVSYQRSRPQSRPGCTPATLRAAAARGDNEGGENTRRRLSGPCTDSPSRAFAHRRVCMGVCLCVGRQAQVRIGRNVSAGSGGGHSPLSLSPAFSLCLCGAGCLVTCSSPVAAASSFVRLDHRYRCPTFFSSSCGRKHAANERQRRGSRRSKDRQQTGSQKQCKVQERQCKVRGRHAPVPQAPPPPRPRWPARAAAAPSRPRRRGTSPACTAPPGVGARATRRPAGTKRATTPTTVGTRSGRTRLLAWLQRREGRTS